MQNRTIDLRGKKQIKNIKTEEHIGRRPEVTFTITFDDDETIIMDLSLLGEITEKASDELDELEKKVSKKIGIGLLATLAAMSGNTNELKNFLKNMK